MTERRWHVARWSGLAWLETGIKLAAVAVAVIALIRGAPPIGRAWTASALAASTLLGLLSVGLVIAIWDRLASREVISVVFVVLSNLGHWSAFARLALTRTIAAPLAVFAGLMLAGDLAKIAFLRRDGFRVRRVSPRALVALTSVYAVGYATILVLFAGFGR